MVVWKPKWKSLLMVQNVLYLNGLQSQVTFTFEYWYFLMNELNVCSLKQMITFVNENEWHVLFCCNCNTIPMYVSIKHNNLVYYVLTNAWLIIIAFMASNWDNSSRLVKFFRISLSPFLLFVEIFRCWIFRWLLLSN